MQNAFSTLSLLSWNLGTLCVLFYIVNKISLCLKSVLIPKLQFLKPKALLSIIVVTKVIVAKVKVMYSGLKMLEAETFFSIRV